MMMVLNHALLCCNWFNDLAASSPRISSIRSLSREFSIGKEGARRLSGFRAAGAWNPTVACASSSSYQLGLAPSELERTRKQIFEDGYAIFPGMWSETMVLEEVGEVVVGQAQEKVLRSFLLDPIDVLPQPLQWLHAPGYGCTDASISPEPYWHHSWQIAGLEGDYLQRPPWSATLVVSLADRTAQVFCGGVAVFPRSHWIMNDRIANSTFDQLSFPKPVEVPAAVPVELRLEGGDAALLHPLLAYTIAPNVSSSSARLLVFQLGDATFHQSELEKCRVDDGQLMWPGWLAMQRFPSDRSSCVAEELVHLQTEEERKAQLGGWQNVTTGLPLGQENLPTSLRLRVAPRDLLAWRLRHSAVQFMLDGQWSNGLGMLLRRAGLRPTCYWNALQAGRCCMRSAPAGQLGGRAGRKCTLEDGERFLLRAIEAAAEIILSFTSLLLRAQMAPGWPIAYAELICCLALMGRGREKEIGRVMEVMKQRCNLEQLCSRYPADSDVLQESWSNCEDQFLKLF